MAKFRNVSVKFWSDPFIESLTPEKKYFFLYLITNEHSSQCGIYEISLRQMAFETGYNQETIEKLIVFFEKQGKIKYSKKSNEIAIRNFVKHNPQGSPKVASFVQKELKQVKDRLLIPYIYATDTLSQEEQEQEETKEEEQEETITSTSVDKSIESRSIDFKVEVNKVGGQVYTPQMLENFIGHWSQPIGKTGFKMKFEKERDSKGWDLNLRLKKWATNNFDKIPCYLTEIKSIQQKKDEFKELLAGYKEKYSSDILNGFYRHWTQPENKPEPVNLRWEGEEHWDMAARLKTWSQSSFNKKPEESYKIPQ